MKNIQNVLAQNLSGGQKRKLTFAIAILGEPQVSQTKFRDEFQILKMELSVAVQTFYLQRTSVTKD